MASCGGCNGEGAHRRLCPKHPNYHPWLRFAVMAEEIGDDIGDTHIANQAWELAEAIYKEIPSRHFRGIEADQ